MKKTLIDTCAWIDFLRSKQGRLGDFVEQAIAEDSAVLCGVIISELLQGAKGEKEKRQLAFLFDNIECMPTQEQDWHQAGLNLQSLREKGLTLPLTDALIATVAKRHSIAVLSVDQHFRHLPIECVNLD